MYDLTNYLAVISNSKRSYTNYSVQAISKSDSNTFFRNDQTKESNDIIPRIRDYNHVINTI